MKTLFIVLIVIISRLAGGGWVMTDVESGEIVGFNDNVNLNDDYDNDYDYDYDYDYDLGELRFWVGEIRSGECGEEEMRKARRVIDAGNVVVAPLLGLKWGQGTRYNSKCPEDDSGQDGHVQVGCGALVMGQIMRYWRYPTTGKGTHGYNSSYGYEYADFGNTTYDYDNMPAKLNASSTDEQIDAVATLLYHCGVAVDMYYGATSSSAQSGKMVTALSRYFRFPATIEYIEKSQYSTSEWHSTLQGELDESAPFFYGASGSYGGHVFICDGYRDDNYYHIVWGWYGQYDGWFKIGAFNPGPYDFNNNHAAIIGIRGPEVPTSNVNVNDNLNLDLVCENPVRDGMLRLNGEHRGEIYDMMGRCWMRFEGESVDVSALGKGVYCLRVENGGGAVIIIDN